MRAILLLLLSALCAFHNESRAQSGCTDPAANNFNAAATINDGSCIYDPIHYDPALRTAISTGIIDECSGLVYTDGKLWTHNDSGNPADIFSIDTATGAVLQTVHIDNHPNNDWEDIAADSNYLYIADCGNNDGTRTNLRILKIAKSAITSAATVHVNAQAINFSYTDQTSFAANIFNNYDCEALISIRDSLYIFTKDRGDGQTRVYKMPKTPGTYALSPYSTFNSAGMITGASYNAATKEIVLIGYIGNKYGSFLWFLNDYAGDNFFSGNKRRVEIGNGGEWQTEGICWLPGNRFFISCEMTSAIPASLYTGDRGLQQPAAVSSLAKDRKCIAYPNPATNLLHIEGIIANLDFAVQNMAGHTVMQGTISMTKPVVSLVGLIPGSYTIVLSDAGRKTIKSISFVKEAADY